MVLTLSAFESAARAWIEYIGMTGDYRPMSVLALFDINAQLYFAMGAMDLNTGFVLEEGFSSSKFWERAVETHATVTCLPGNALVMLDNMPESEVDSTHYRVLFLAALVLFLFTFVFNTLAEIIRQRLREKYSSL